MPTVSSHMYVLAPDHLWYLSLQPEGPSRTRIRYGAAIAPEVLEAKTDRDPISPTQRPFSTRFRMKTGMLSRVSSRAPVTSRYAGPLSWLERENHEFAQYIARRLCDPDQKTDA